MSEIPERLAKMEAHLEFLVEATKSNQEKHDALHDCIDSRLVSLERLQFYVAGISACIVGAALYFQEEVKTKLGMKG